MISNKIPLLLATSFAMIGSPSARADLSAPGAYQAGYLTLTVARPDGSTFSAILFYPAATAGQSAPYDATGAPYPAISFGHGFLTPVTRYQSTLEHLATWGYLVIAAQSAGGLFPNHADFAQDMSTCLTWLEEQNSDSNSVWYQQVDVAHFGLCGHSMGGGASILAAEQDTRVRALANMAAANTTPSAVSAIANVRIPVRLLAGSDDSIVPPSGDTESMYNNAKAPKQMPIILGGSHRGFLDSDIIFCDSGSIPRSAQLAITRRALTAFFNLYLQGDQTAWSQVRGPAYFGDATLDSSRTDAGIVLTPGSTTAAGLAGASASATFTVMSAGPLATSFTVLFEENAWTCFASPDQTPVLNPGEGCSFSVEIQLPADSGGQTEGMLVTARRDADDGTRAYSALTVSSRRRGDFDGDGAVTTADMNVLIDVLLGLDSDPDHLATADLNMDDDADGRDIQPFVSALMGS